MFLTCCDRFVNTSIFFFTEKSITCEEKYFFFTCEENFPHTSIKEPFRKRLPYQHTDLINAIQEKLRKTFCCYNCLDLYHAQSFFPSVCYLFSQFSQAGIVSRKGHKFSAYGLELAQPFLNTIFLLSRTGKKVTHTWKNFSHGKSRQL